MKLSILVIISASAILIGCGTTFQERKEVYKDVYGAATNALRSGALTNDVNAIRALENK